MLLFLFCVVEFVLFLTIFFILACSLLLFVSFILLVLFWTCDSIWCSSWFLFLNSWLLFGWFILSSCLCSPVLLVLSNSFFYSWARQTWKRICCGPSALFSTTKKRSYSSIWQIAFCFCGCAARATTSISEPHHRTSAGPLHPPIYIHTTLSTRSWKYIIIQSIIPHGSVHHTT